MNVSSTDGGPPVLSHASDDIHDKHCTKTQHEKWQKSPHEPGGEVLWCLMQVKAGKQHSSSITSSHDTSILDER